MLISCLKTLTKTILISRRNCVFYCCCWRLCVCVFFYHYFAHLFFIVLPISDGRSPSLLSHSLAFFLPCAFTPLSFLLICRCISFLFIHIINFFFSSLSALYSRKLYCFWLLLLCWFILVFTF